MRRKCESTMTAKKVREANCFFKMKEGCKGGGIPGINEWGIGLHIIIHQSFIGISI